MSPTGQHGAGQANQPSEAERRDFVVRNTLLRTTPGLPEIRLHLADEVVPIWEMTEEELGVAGVDPPFWAFAWAGGQGVARYLLDHPGTVAGRRVLDLAAGSGLAGIAARKAGATQVTVADVDPYALTAAQLNAQANGVTVRTMGDDLLARHWPADWPVGGQIRVPVDGPPGAAGPADAQVILAGDVCYERAMAARMLGWLRQATRCGVTVLLGDPQRGYLDRRDLVALAAYDMPTIPDLEETDVKRVTVYRMDPADESAGPVPGAASG